MYTLRKPERVNYLFFFRVAIDKNYMVFIDQNI